MTLTATLCAVIAQIADHFGYVTIAKARQAAKDAGWMTKNGEPWCPDCQVRTDEADDETE